MSEKNSFIPSHQPGFQAPPPGYNVAMSPPPPITMQPQVITMNVVPVGPTTTHMMCPSCHATISTRTQSEATTKTHLMALLLCVFGCIPCMCVPYCMDSCQNTNHYCPNCNAFLGAYKS